MDTYEKKYKEALELARVAAFNGHQSLMEGIFPELKESEDERIRKELIKVFSNREKYLIDQSFGDITVSEILTWLEKQGEQSSLNINRECLKGIKRVQEYQDLSDWEKEFDNIASMYAHNKNQEGYNDSWYVKERAAEMLYYAKKELEKQGGQKPWSEKDEKEYKYVLKFVDNILNNCGNKKDYDHCKKCYDWLKSLKQRIGG